MARASATPSISFTGPGAGPDRGPLAAETFPDERTADVALRPKRFDEYVGQRAVLDKLKVYVQAAKKRQEPLDHALFCGPPGLGKTSLAHLIAQELGVEIHVTSGPAVERKGDLAGILTNLARGQILFIDEIHRLAAPIEETLYPAMEDFQLDVVFETGPAARTLKLPLERFTLIGATTRGGLLTSPLRDRFQIVERLDYYTPEDLASIAVRSAGLLGIPLDQSGAKEIGRRSRGTPRIANRLLRRIRDFAEVQGTGHIDQRAADSALRQLEIDALGLDVMDRRILVTIMDNFDGGPVGLETIAASVGEERDTLEDVYEPFLIQQGLLQRTPRGRVATARAYEHLGRQTPRVDPREISSKMTEAAQALFARDFFFEVMKDSQRLRAGYLAERERWLRNLAVDGREEVLFEFEMLLRALERYFNVHNLPLEPRSDMLNRDFTEELAAVREAVARAVQLTQLLLDPPSNRNLVFRKFLETQLADDRTRGKLLEQQLSQETPQESLFLLRGGFVALRGVLDSLLKLPHQSYQTFQDVGQLIVREVALNKYFRPFRPLEFRPEYDRIKSVRILEILRKPLETVAQNEKVRRPVSLAFLGFFRLLHYLRYVPVGRDETHRRGYLTLALVRSETASLAVFLEGEVAAALVDVGSRPASGVTRIALELRKETTKVYGRFMSDVSPGDQVAAGRVREALESHFKQWITSLAQLFQPEIDGKELFDDYVSRKEQARRLRQDLWAFREVCKLCDRAAQRGTATDMEDALRRLRRFLAYFQDVSYQLLRYGDYGPFNRFVQIVSEADVTKLAQPRTRRQFRDDCRAFGEVVAQTFEAVSKREELSGQPFIEAEAARVLEEIAA